ncbi:hypothetical protein GCM10018953_54590 [Streptosporangium nondiastaticum]|uniref:hypothetical protein n=1 Tax=Streptosporangium nondiastaticum TaxID=35764 RepID=UPI0031F7BFCA
MSPSTLGALLPSPEEACRAPVEAGAAVLWDAEAPVRYGTPVPAPGIGPHDAGWGAGAALHGLPAITRHRYGAGTALYVSTRLPDADLTRLLGLEPSPLELVRRGEWVFTVNHGDDEQQVPDGPLLPPGGYAVRRARQG